MPNVTVLVPSYGHAQFIERSLRSIFAQTLRPGRLIVIDDGSPDGSPGVIERVLADAPLDAQFIARENRGLCSTLNEGFAMADGEFFAYLGSDDIWLPEFLAEQTRLLTERTNALLAFSHAYVIDEDDNIFDRTDTWTKFADGDLLPTLLAGEIFSSPGVVYRTNALRRYGWNENAVLEDYELYLNMAADGEFARNEKLLCAWRRHGRNTSDNAPKMLREQMAAQERLFETLGIERRKFEAMQKRMRFKSAAEHIRGGYRKEARRLIRENLGAASVGETLKMLARLAAPTALFEANRYRKRKRAIQEYGKLTV